MTTDSATQSPPRLPDGGAAPRLTRSRDDRLIGGVASGLADHFNLDPVLVRIGFVLFAVLGGGGVILYLALWLLVPERQSGEVLADRATGWARDEATRVGSYRGVGFWIGVGLIAIAAVILLNRVVDGGVVLALLLIGIGVALFRSSGATGPTAPSAPPVPSASETSPVPPDASGPPPAVASDAGPPVPRSARERSILGRLTLGLAVLWVGVAALLDEASADIDFTLAGVVGVAMAILGAGLLVGAFVGRARWLVLIAILLTPVLVVASLLDRVDVPFSAGVGERSRIVSAANNDLNEQLFAGELRIAVADVAAGGDRRVDATVGVGRILVEVPPGWNLVIDARVDLGEIHVLGSDTRHIDGLSKELHRRIDGEVGAPTLHLELELVVGLIDIRLDGDNSTALAGLAPVRATTGS